MFLVYLVFITLATSHTLRDFCSPSRNEDIEVTRNVDMDGNKNNKNTRKERKYNVIEFIFYYDPVGMRHIYEKHTYKNNSTRCDLDPLQSLNIMCGRRLFIGVVVYHSITTSYSTWIG